VTSIGTAKRCGTCRETKPIGEFGRDRSRGDGHCFRCRVCHRAANRAVDLRRRVARQSSITPPPAQPPPWRCVNCADKLHGPMCAVSLYGHPYCACRCRAVLGMDGPFQFGDPTGVA
jgi:hypothetical protein